RRNVGDQFHAAITRNNSDAVNQTPDRIVAGSGDFAAGLQIVEGILQEKCVAFGADFECALGRSPVADSAFLIREPYRRRALRPVRAEYSGVSVQADRERDRT